MRGRKFFVWDLLTVAQMVHPELFTQWEVACDVVVEGESQGRLVRAGEYLRSCEEDATEFLPASAPAEGWLDDVVGRFCCRCHAYKAVRAQASVATCVRALDRLPHPSARLTGSSRRLA